MTSKLPGGRQCWAALTSSEPLAVQVGAEQGSAHTELGGHSDSVRSPLRMHAAPPAALSQAWLSSWC